MPAFTFCSGYGKSVFWTTYYYPLTYLGLVVPFLCSHLAVFDLSIDGYEKKVKVRTWSGRPDRITDHSDHLCLLPESLRYSRAMIF